MKILIIIGAVELEVIVIEQFLARVTALEVHDCS